MVQVWRLIDSDLVDGTTSQAIDEALLEARVKEMVPNTLHLYRRKPPAISIGKFQKVENIVNLEYCRQEGIDILRRISGGREVYTDSNCLEYAVIVNQNSQEIPNDIIESFKTICTGIITALKKLGIDASYKPINDVLVRGRKISGNAQRRRGQVVLQHGTLLVDADFESMRKSLKSGADKLTDKLTTIRREARQMLTIKEVKEVLKIGFEETLSMKLEEGALSQWEELRIRKLIDKYSSKSWIFAR